MIQTILFLGFNDKYKLESINTLIKKFYVFKQDRAMPNSTYFEKYQILLEVLKNRGVDLGCEPGLVKSELNEINPKVNEINITTRLKLFDAGEAVRKKYTAMAFLLPSDRNRYRKLLEDLENSIPRNSTICSRQTKWKPTASLLTGTVTQHIFYGS